MAEVSENITQGESRTVAAVNEQTVDAPNSSVVISGGQTGCLDNVVNNLSKRQLKKIQKKELWLSKKAEKRRKERVKTKEKRAFARAHNIDLGPSRKALKKCTMADSPCKVTVSIDMSFDHLMIDKDIAKLIKQILRCYTLNRRAQAPIQFSVTGFNGKSEQEMEKHNGYQHWDVKFYAESYLEIYDPKKVVYLTSESDNVIDTLEQDFVYVIGGLVDHNQQKGLCHELAQKASVAHARLPLDKFLKMKSRKVLTIDHVFEILVKVTEGITWQDAFLQVLPLRKNAEPMCHDDTTDRKSNHGDNDETMSCHDDNPCDTASTMEPQV